MDGRENDKYYLGNAKKTRLLHGLCQMVAQVFIVLRSDDWQELF